MVGQCIGLLTMVLLAIQVMLALRPRFLVRAFGAATLLDWHRTNGVSVVGTALAHVLLVLAPEGLANLPLGWRYWPEMVGALALFALLTTVVLSQYRSRLQLSYQRWKMVHRPLGYLIVLLPALHVLFVSESFSGGLPRMGLVTVLLLLFFSSALSWIRRGRQTPPSTTNV
jgi:predicted ferric reductase